MSTAGYLAKVRVGGVSTAMTDEALTLVSGTTYQITDSTKQVWDHTIPFTFEDDGVSPQSDLVVSSIDWLFGKVTFSLAPGGTPTLKTGNFLPISFVGGGHSYTLNHAGDLLDDTTFESAQSDGGMRSRTYGLRDVSITISRWDDVLQTFFDALNNRTRMLFEVQPGGLGPVARGWFIGETEGHTGSVSELESADITFQLDGDEDSLYGSNVSFNWSDN